MLLVRRDRTDGAPTTTGELVRLLPKLSTPEPLRASAACRAAWKPLALPPPNDPDVLLVLLLRCPRGDVT